ncbi:MAG: TQO small subunit DoxD [Candidatus Aenigmarchaeota archaeon]|nr:TQO small subunit DoxD [Candidatus Aenigmarchaeota archaeon]
MRIFKAAKEYCPDFLMSSVRVLYGIMWLGGASWKAPPLFGLASNDSLRYWIVQGVQHPVWPPYTAFVEHVVLPNFLLFEWIALILELLLGIGFILGIRLKLLGMLAVFHSVNIALTVSNVPNEWPWSYYLMAMVGAVFIVHDTSKISAEYLLRKIESKK